MEDIEYTPEEIAEEAMPMGLRVVECTSDEDKEIYYQHLKEYFFQEKITLKYFDDKVKGYIPVADR